MVTKEIISHFHLRVRQLNDLPEWENRDAALQRKMAWTVLACPNVYINFVIISCKKGIYATLHTSYVCHSSLSGVSVCPPKEGGVAGDRMGVL